jgi:hypothetical protein
MSVIAFHEKAGRIILTSGLKNAVRGQIPTDVFCETFGLESDHGVGDILPNVVRINSLATSRDAGHCYTGGHLSNYCAGDKCGVLRNPVRFASSQHRMEAKNDSGFSQSRQ